MQGGEGSLLRLSKCAGRHFCISPLVLVLQRQIAHIALSTGSGEEHFWQVRVGHLSLLIMGAASAPQRPSNAGSIKRRVRETPVPRHSPGV